MAPFGLVTNGRGTSSGYVVGVRRARSGLRLHGEAQDPRGVGKARVVREHDVRADSHRRGEMDRIEGAQLVRSDLPGQRDDGVVDRREGDPRRRLDELTMRGSDAKALDRASSAIAADLGRRPVATLTALLRARAEQRLPAPAVGPMGQFVDCCVHLRDAARPLRAHADSPLDDWALVLAWLPSRAAGLGHVPRGLLPGLSWRATDLPWSYGAGPAIEARAEPLALAMTGRAAVLPELTGPGVPQLARRLRMG